MKTVVMIELDTREYKIHTTVTWKDREKINRGIKSSSSKYDKTYDEALKAYNQILESFESLKKELEQTYWPVEYEYVWALTRAYKATKYLALPFSAKRETYKKDMKELNKLHSLELESRKNLWETKKETIQWIFDTNCKYLIDTWFVLMNKTIVDNERTIIFWLE